MRFIPLSCVALFLMAGGCMAERRTAKPPRNADADGMRLNSQSLQEIEGRLTYEEQQILENQEPRTRRRIVLAFSGTRRHRKNAQSLQIRDDFTQVRIMEASPPANSPSSFSVEFTHGREEPEFVFRTKPENELKFLTDSLERLYPAAHFVFSGKLRENLQESVKIPMTVRVADQALHTARPFEFRVKSWHRTRLQNQLSLRGEYLSTELGVLQLDEFGASCVGKAEIETDFELDSGVWTRIDAREILGWAAMGFDEATLQPVQVGHRRIIHLQMQLTDVLRKEN